MNLHVLWQCVKHESLCVIFLKASQSRECENAKTALDSQPSVCGQHESKSMDASAVSVNICSLPNLDGVQLPPACKPQWRWTTFASVQVNKEVRVPFLGMCGLEQMHKGRVLSKASTGQVLVKYKDEERYHDSSEECQVFDLSHLDQHSTGHLDLNRREGKSLLNADNDWCWSKTYPKQAKRPRQPPGFYTQTTLPASTKVQKEIPPAKATDGVKK